ncbi:transposable element Tcb1 transposase [Trichonephila clavipes]|nr:transposable element Tcb1 transposase [Trichonephila clavipes]
MEDSERWRAVGRIEAGQSITDVALFFGVHHYVIPRLWKQFQTTQTVVRRPVSGRPRATTPAKYRYIAIVSKWNRRVTSTRVTSMVTASIGKAISAATVPRRADIVDDYLESEGIARMAWPAYSPDLNPIENLWDALGHAVCSRFPPPATLTELEIVLQEEWRLLSSTVVDHLIESMVRRCSLCIQMRGDHIPY